MHRSLGLIDEERDLARLKGEVDEAVLLVHRVAAERLAEEHVPRGLPRLVHVVFHESSNLIGEKANLLVSVIKVAQNSRQLMQKF